MNLGDSCVYLVDDDASVRRAVERLIRAEGGRVQAFASAGMLLSCPRHDGPCCLVLDLRLPDASGLQIQQRLAQMVPSIPIIFITGYGDIPASVKAIKAGAIDFLSKPFEDEELLGAIRQALDKDRQQRLQLLAGAEERGRFQRLTPREREVVGGLLNKQVAMELGVGEKTVKVHRARVMEKMQADSLADLVRLSARLNIQPGDLNSISPPDGDSFRGSRESLIFN